MLIPGETLEEEKRVVEGMKMNSFLSEGIFLLVVRKYRYHDVPGIIRTALVNPAQQSWAQIGVGAEKDCWDIQGDGEADNRKRSNTGCALVRMSTIR